MFIIRGDMMKLWLSLIVLIVFYLSQTYSKIDLSQFELEKIQVEIKGEIKEPGVYHLSKDATYEDVIKVAGGVKPEATLDAINLSKKVEHESVIVIPKKQETCISLNQADIKALTQISGVGEAIANRIIAYRKEHSFQTIEDVMKIKGIKEKLFNKMKDDICL